MSQLENTPSEAGRSDRTTALVARLWRDWMRPYRWVLLGNLLLIFLFAGVNSLYPEMIRRSIDALSAGDTDALAFVALAIVAIAVLKGTVQYAQRIVAATIMARIETDLQTVLYRKLVDADIAALGREASASLAARFSADVTLARQAFETLANTLIRDAMLVIGLFGAMLFIDWELTLISMAIFPIAIWPVIAIGRRLRKLSTATAQGVTGMTALVSESLSGVQVAKTYCMEPYLKSKTTRSFENLRSLKVRAARHQSLIDPIMELLGGVTVAAVIYLIGSRIAAGTNTLGDITGFVGALLIAAQPLRALGNMNAKVQSGLAGLRRVFELLDEAPKIVDPPNAPALAVSKGQIEFDDVSFFYTADQPAIRDFSLRVAGGARVALVGRSGAGKSTLFNLVPRLYDVNAGAVRIDGQDVRSVSQNSLRASIALVSQEAMLFNDTIAANIEFGRPGATREQIADAARAAALHDFIETLPEGYDTQVGERGDRLSGGQKQRLSIARAFLRDAPILLLDEATSALDAESEDAIRKAFDRLSDGRTTLIIAHRLSTVLDADQIAVMDQGRLVELGPHDELLARGGLYASLYQLQFAAMDAA